MISKKSTSSNNSVEENIGDARDLKCIEPILIKDSSVLDIEENSRYFKGNKIIKNEGEEDLDYIESTRGNSYNNACGLTKNIFGFEYKKIENGLDENDEIEDYEIGLKPNDREEKLHFKKDQFLII